jgi:Alpha-tubulin suppressor and related RCC1 domain-containing proteins
MDSGGLGRRQHSQREHRAGCRDGELQRDRNLPGSEIAAGTGHSCAVTPAGVAFCWGDNSTGGLGDNSLTNRLIPTAVAGGHAFSQISAGRLYSCALTGAGAGWCWGLNTLGALGNGTTALDSVPQAVSGGMVFQAITTGQWKRPPDLRHQQWRHGLLLGR